MSPSEKLGALAPWQWLLDLSPGWVLAVMLFISPVVIKFVMRPLWEGRILRREDEFLTFQCDIALAPALASGLELVRAMDDRVYLRADNPAHWVILSLAILLGVAHYLQERKFYSWRQMTTLTKIYHELLFPFIGYGLALVGIYGLIYAPWTFRMIAMRLIFIVSVGIWAAAWPVYDEKHKHDIIEDGHDRYWFAHPEDGHPWQHKYRHLGWYWRRYVNDWRLVPGRLRRFYRRLTV